MYMESVKSRCSGDNKNKSKRFIHVPVGDTMHRGKLPPEVRDALEEMGSVTPTEAVHQQGEEDTCVFSSFACALHHSGRVREAQRVQDSVTKQMVIGKADTEIGNLQEHVLNNIKELRVWRLRGDEKTQFAMNLDAFDKSAIYSVIINAMDGHQSHCVAIYDGWIFDSNEKSALPLCQASLDFICCEGERKAEFEGFLCGYKFFAWKTKDGIRKIVQKEEKEYEMEDDEEKEEKKHEKKGEKNDDKDEKNDNGTKRVVQKEEKKDPQEEKMNSIPKKHEKKGEKNDDKKDEKNDNGAKRVVQQEEKKDQQQEKTYSTPKNVRRRRNRRKKRENKAQEKNSIITT